MVDVAKALNITKQSVHQWSTGKSVPSSDTLIALADYFDVSVDYLVGRSDNPKRR
ncbi:MAG: helix-turn-helix domain-containing protein [Defluviitaleaceae bacterium]|nr:helix-turn-helix domain-containing protein [Defluviitaleaceae bacterium]